MSQFHGLHALFLEQFVDFKKSLGYQFTDAESTYRLFDRFTREQGETAIGITAALAEQWAVKRPNESDSTCYRRVMYLRQFAAFINDLIFTHKFLAASSPSSSRVIIRGRVFSSAKKILIAVSQSKGICDFLSNL